MELAAKAAAVCIAGALTGLVIREGAPSLSLLLTLGVTAAVLLSLSGPAAETADFFRELGARSGLSPALLPPLYRTVCIGIVVRTGGALCRDAGASALSEALETAGAVCALLASLPLLRAVLDLLTGLLS